MQIMKNRLHCGIRLLIRQVQHLQRILWPMVSQQQPQWEVIIMHCLHYHYKEIRHQLGQRTRLILSMS